MSKTFWRGERRGASHRAPRPVVPQGAHALAVPGRGLVPVPPARYPVGIAEQLDDGVRVQVPGTRLTTLREHAHRVRVGDVFTSGADALAHGINVTGTGGSGFAALVRDRYPLTDYAYNMARMNGIVHPGDVFTTRERGDYVSDGHGGTLFVASGRGQHTLYVFNVASQYHPGADARVEWMAKGLEAMMAAAREHGVRSVAMPLIGGGIGGISPQTALDTVLEATRPSPGFDAAVTVWLVPERPAAAARYASAGAGYDEDDELDYEDAVAADKLEDGDEFAASEREPWDGWPQDDEELDSTYEHAGHERPLQHGLSPLPLVEAEHLEDFPGGDEWRPDGDDGDDGDGDGDETGWERTRRSAGVVGDEMDGDDL